MLRDLVVERRGWLPEEEFEDGIAAANLLPGPASTQLAIFTAWRVGGVPAALVGGACFIVPGLLLIVALAALFLADAPPDWVLGAGAGTGAAVAAVALRAGLDLVPGSRTRAGSKTRWLVYAVAGGLGAMLAGPYVVLVLLACGAVELGLRARPPALTALPLPLAAFLGGDGGALTWTAFKVGALSYGGGFVIIPLMQADAVDVNGWLTDGQFLNAVALGQVTPGPVVHTVAAVGYGAAGLGGAALAAAVAFAPSFALVLLLAPRFDALRANDRVRAFLDGAGPAAIGAILGVTVPLALALSEPWQAALLAAAAVVLLTKRAGVVTVLLAAGVVGAVVGLAGGPLPR